MVSLGKLDAVVRLLDGITTNFLVQSCEGRIQMAPETFIYKNIKIKKKTVHLLNFLNRTGLLSFKIIKDLGDKIIAGVILISSFQI